MKVLFLGNCQVNALRGLFREMYPQQAADFQTITPFWGKYDEAQTRALLADANLVISQAIANPDTPFNTRDVLASTKGEVVFVPYIYVDGLASLEIVASKGKTVIKGADVLLDGQAGRKPIHIFQDYCDGQIDMQCSARVNASLVKMAEKEAADCDLVISDYLRETWRKQPTLYGINHPTQDVVFEMFRRLCDHVGWVYDPALRDDPIAWGRRALPLGQRSLTPYDVAAMGLQYPADSHWYGQAYKLINLAIKAAERDTAFAKAA